MYVLYSSIEPANSEPRSLLCVLCWEQCSTVPFAPIVTRLTMVREAAYSYIALRYILCNAVHILYVYNSTYIITHPHRLALIETLKNTNKCEEKENTIWPFLARCKCTILYWQTQDGDQHDSLVRRILHRPSALTLDVSDSYWLNSHALIPFSPCSCHSFAHECDGQIWHSSHHCTASHCSWMYFTLWMWKVLINS